MIKVVCIFKQHIYDEDGTHKPEEFEVIFATDRKMPKRKSYKFLKDLELESKVFLTLSGQGRMTYNKYGIEFVKFKSIEEIK
jgi:hypothetical protein